MFQTNNSPYRPCLNNNQFKFGNALMTYNSMLSRYLIKQSNNVNVCINRLINSNETNRYHYNDKSSYGNRSTYEIVHKEVNSIIYQLQSGQLIVKVWTIDELSRNIQMIETNDYIYNINSNNSNNETRGQHSIIKFNHVHVINELYHQTEIIVSEKLVAYNELTTEIYDKNDFMKGSELQSVSIMKSYRKLQTKSSKNYRQFIFPEYTNSNEPLVYQSTQLVDSNACEMTNDNIDCFDTAFEIDDLINSVLTDKPIDNCISNELNSEHTESILSGDEGYYDSDSYKNYEADDDCTEQDDEDFRKTCLSPDSTVDILYKTKRHLKKASKVKKVNKNNKSIAKLSYCGDCDYNSSNSRSSESRNSEENEKFIVSSLSESGEDDDDEGMAEEHEIIANLINGESQNDEIDVLNGNTSSNCSNIYNDYSNDQDDGSDSDGGSELLKSVNNSLHKFNSFMHDSIEPLDTLKNVEYWCSNEFDPLSRPPNCSDGLRESDNLTDKCATQLDTQQFENQLCPSKPTNCIEQVQQQAQQPYQEGSHINQLQKCHQNIPSIQINNVSQSSKTVVNISSMNNTTSSTNTRSTIKLTDHKVFVPRSNLCTNLSTTPQYPSPQTKQYPNLNNKVNVLNNFGNSILSRSLSSDPRIKHNATQRPNEQSSPKKCLYNSKPTRSNTPHKPISLVSTPPTQSRILNSGNATPPAMSPINSPNRQSATGHTHRGHMRPYHMYPSPPASFFNLQSSAPHFYPTPQGHLINPTPQGHIINTTPQGHIINTTPQGHIINTAPQGHPINTTPQGHIINTAPQGHPISARPYPIINHRNNEFYPQPLMVPNGIPNNKIYYAPRNPIVPASSYPHDMSKLIINPSHINYQRQPRHIQMPHFSPTNEIAHRNVNYQYFTNAPPPTTSVYNYSTNNNNITNNGSSLISSQISNNSYTPTLQYRNHYKPYPIEKSKRACCFFMRGRCKKDDCEYSHDLSKVTCKFWEKGDCFKSKTCPFNHGE